MFLHLLLFFALVINLEFVIIKIKKNVIFIGSYIAHIGIALFMLGVIATGGFTQKQQVDLVEGESTKVLGYDLTFTGYEPIENNTKYAFNIEIKKGDNITKAKPVMYIAEFNNSLMREPDILNLITKDFYIEPLGYNDEQGNTTGSEITIKKGETQKFENNEITFTGFNFPEDAMKSMSAGTGFQIGALFNVSYNGKTETVETIMKSVGGKKDFLPVDIKDADLRIEMTNLDASGVVNVKFSKLSDPNPMFFKTPPSLSIEASTKPFIMLVWFGVVFMVLGFILATIKRTKESQVV